VEWSERAAEILGDCVRVDIRRGEREEERILEIGGIDL
jgi:hypothetical protein